MTVLHVLLRAGLGGTESLCLDLVRHLETPRFRSELVVLTESEGPVFARAGALGAAAHVCRIDGGNRISFARRFARLCRDRAAGALVIYAFGLHPLVALAGRLAGVRRIVVSAGSAPPEGLLDRLKYAVLAQLGRPFVDREVACSRYVCDRLVSAYYLPRRRVTLALNGCDTREIHERAAQTRALRSSTAPSLIMVSRMDRAKDHESVIRAFGRARVRYPEARLTLVGDGPTKPRLQSLAAALGLGDVIEFTGSRADIPELLGTSDIFVFAGRRLEGFAIVLAEAMAAGLPVVCTNVGPCAEVTGGGECGIVTAPAVDALAQGMESLLADPALRRRLGKQARRFAQAHYDARETARRFQEVLAG